MIRLATVVVAVALSVFPFTVRAHPASHWDFVSFRSGERVACAMFATDVANGNLAPEVAFDALAPCSRMGFVYGGSGWVLDCGSAAGIYWPAIPRPNDLPRCKR
jgi:hypothetical protein